MIKYRIELTIKNQINIFAIKYLVINSENRIKNRQKIIYI